MLRVTLFLTCLRLAYSQVKWENVSIESDSAPSPRRDSAIGYDSINNKLILFGGRDSSTSLDDTWVFSIQTKTWSKVNTTNAPDKRFSMVFGSTKTHFYVSTGEKAGGTYFDDIHRFNFINLTWEALEPQGNTKPEKRYGSGGGIWRNMATGEEGDGLYITHGFAGERYSNTFKFDFAKGEWQEKFKGTNSYHPYLPHARCLHAATMTNLNQLVMFGGCLGGGGSGGPCPAEDSWLFDAMETKWTMLGQCTTPRVYSAMAMLPFTDKSVRRAVLYGGTDTGKSVLYTSEVPASEISVLDLETNKWTLKKVEGSTPAKRSGHVMVTTKFGIVLFGGSVSGKGLSNELWFLRGNGSDVDENPSGGDCEGLDFNLIMLHGLLMFIGWGILLQAGAFIGRYFRHKDPWWFKMHRGLQASGLLVAIGGFICAVLSVPFDHFMFAHGTIGLLVMFVGLLQPLNAILRPHKFPDGSKSRKRIIWEWFHKLSGRLALIFALINISLGVFMAVVPFIGWLIWFILLGALVLLYIVMEVRLYIRNRRSGTVTFPMEEKGSENVGQEI